MTEPPDPGNRIRLEQGLNYHLSSRQVGVMNVYEDATGEVVVQLSVYDPVTSSDDCVTVRRDDEVTLGSQRYRVIDVVNATSGERAWVELAPARRRRLSWPRREPSN